MAVKPPIPATSVVYKPNIVTGASPEVKSALDSINNYLSVLQGQVSTLAAAHQALQEKVTSVQSSATQTQQKVSSLPNFDILVGGDSTQINGSQASILPAHVSGGMTYVAASSGTVTFYWDGTNGSSQVQIAWPNQTLTSIPLGNISVTGLATGVTYNFYPAYDVRLGVVQWSPQGATPNCPPGTGTPPIAYAPANFQAAAAADGDGMQSLSDGPIQITIPATGSTSGSCGGK